MGQEVFKRAAHYVRGTDWESVLFPTFDAKTERMLKKFRAAWDEESRIAEVCSDSEIKEREAKSVVYLEQRRKEKQSRQPDPDGAA